MATAASNDTNEDRNKRDTMLTTAATPPTNRKRMNSELTGCLASSSSGAPNLITARQGDEACSRNLLPAPNGRHVEFEARRASPNRQWKLNRRPTRPGST